MIYLDHNATAPLRPEALAAMEQTAGTVGNPASSHAAGREARRRLQACEEAVARLVGAAHPRVVLTGSGSEADALALLGIARRRRASTGADEIVTSRIEHPAVAAACERLAADGFSIRRIGVDGSGRTVLAEVAAALTKRTALVSVMLANNETGVMQPLAEVVAAARAHEIPVHTDAVQAAGKTAVGFDELGVAALSLSAHKFGGPKGVGALVLRPGVELEPLWYGGGQQGGLRSGTPPTLLASGMAAAARAALAGLAGEQALARMRDELARKLCERLTGAFVLGEEAARLPNTLAIGFEGVASAALVAALDDLGVMASGGSACHAGVTAPSAVLLAMGLAAPRALQVVRLSLGWTTTREDVAVAAARVEQAVRNLRAKS